MTLQIQILSGLLTFNLHPHPMTEEPATVRDHIAYLKLPDSSVLHVGHWRGGRWLKHGRKPFEGEPECWYSLELVDKAREVANDGA